MGQKIKKSLEKYYFWKQVFLKEPPKSYEMGSCDGCSGCGGSSGGCKGSPDLHLLSPGSCTGCSNCQAGCKSGGCSVGFEV